MCTCINGLSDKAKVFKFISTSEEGKYYLLLNLGYFGVQQTLLKCATSNKFKPLSQSIAKDCRQRIDVSKNDIEGKWKFVDVRLDFWYTTSRFEYWNFDIKD